MHETWAKVLDASAAWHVVGLTVLITRSIAPGKRTVVK